MEDTKNTGSRKISETAEDTSQAKRRLLVGLGAGGGVLGISALVPASWVKPVVNAVMLPAHAIHSPGHPASPDDGMDGGPTEEELAAIAARSPATITVEGDPDDNAGLGQAWASLLRAYVAWTPPSDAAAAAEVDAYVVSWRNVTETEFRTNTAVQTRGPSIRNTTTPSLPANDPITRADSWFVQVEAVYNDADGNQPEADVGKYVTTATVTTDHLLMTIFSTTIRTLRITSFNDVGPYTGLLGQLDDLLE